MTRRLPCQCIIGGASFGRDCDTIASIAGCIAGAMQRAGAIRPEWIDACEVANRAIFLAVDGDPSANFRRMAERMVEALRKTRRR
ncbi:MAG: hypothetical protein ACUVRM_11185 [Bacillota bacterium]